MIRKPIMDNLEIKITTAAVFLFLLFSVLFAPSTFANERCANDEISITKLSLDKSDDKTIYQVIDTNHIVLKKEIKLLPDLTDVYSVDGIKLARVQQDELRSFEKEVIFNNPAIPEYETETIDAGDILRSIPGISTEDNKTLGLIIPPFAYFAKKF